MFKLLRYFALSSFVFVSIAAVVLAVFSQHILNQTLLEHGEEENQAIAGVIGVRFEQQALRLLQAQSPSQRAQLAQWLDRDLQELLQGRSIDRVQLYDTRAKLIYQYPSQGLLQAQPSISRGELQPVVSGRLESKLRSKAEGDRHHVETLIPLSVDAVDNDAVLALTTDVTGLYQRIENNRFTLGIASAIVMLLLYTVLYVIVRYADRELNKQHQSLQTALRQQRQIKQELEQRVHDRTEVLNKEIRERRQIEYSLREQERYLQAVMSNTFNAIVCIDRNGIVLSFNPTAERLFGYSEAEMVGQNVSLLMPSEYAARHDHYIARYLETGVGGIIGNLRELQGLRKNGAEFPIELAITETEVDGMPLFIGTIRDISDQKAAEQALFEARQKYYHQEKMAAIGFLSAGLVHEIGNPVAAISGLLDGICNPELNDGLDKLPCNAHANAQLAMVQEQLERIVKITRDVSEFATPQTQDAEYQDLNNLIGRTVRLMRHDRRFADVTVKLNLDKQIPAIFGVGDHLIQVLMNLLVNAVDAVADMPGSKHQIQVSSGLEGDRVWFEVSDNGCGMDAEVLSHAREAFYTTKPVGRGTGLGLSLCQSLLSEQGAQMQISSQPGEGTQVRVELLTQPQVEPTISLPQ